MADEYPLVTLADGPTGRRPRLVGTGLDVCEVVSVVRDNDGNEQAADTYLQIPADLVTAPVA
jgi:hypothetical protein